MKNITLTSPLNPLHHYLIVAKINSKFWELCNDKKFSNIYLGNNYLIPLPKGSNQVSFPTYNGKCIYPDIAMAGVAGLYRELTKNSNYKIIFSNELAYEIHGIDALAYNKKENQYLICEAKGTTIGEKSPAYYLKKTKKRGRQLSWQWCWNCIIDFAEFPATANVFLELYGPLILHTNIKRLLRAC